MGAVTRSLPRAVALCLAICLSALAGMFGAAPARADEVTLGVELTDVQVLGGTPQSEVVLSGRVTNRGTVPTFTVQVILWRSAEPITELARYREVAAGTSTPYGSRVVRREANYANLTTGSAPFAPGASGTFTVRTTVAESGFARTGAAYLVGVDVRASRDGSSAYQTYARSRTLAPLPGATSRATFVPVVLFTSKPSQLYGTYFNDDHLAAELAPTGRLTQLLDLAESERLDWIIDPGLYVELTAMKAGYTVRTPGGGTVAGRGAEEAEAWLARFAELPIRSGHRTMFGAPDLEHAARYGDQRVLTRAKEALTGVPDEIAGLPLLALPAGLQGTDAAANFVRSAKPEALLTTLLRTEKTLVAGAVPLVRVWAAPATPDGVQRALARRLFATTEAMLLGQHRQQLVRVLTTTADIADAEALPDWVRRSSLRALLQTTPDAGPATFAQANPAVGLSRDAFASLGETETHLRTFAALSPRSPQAAATDAILARGAAGAWSGRATDRSVWLHEATGDAIAALGPDMVELHAAGKFVMSSNVNEFPVTITNRFTYPVVVTVKLSSSSPQRLTIPDVPAVTVNPGESRTVNVKPEAGTNGVATVTAQLATDTGTLIGSPIEIIVESTQFGLVGWAIVIVSGIVLIATTAWSINKTKGRTRAKEKA